MAKHEDWFPVVVVAEFAEHLLLRGLHSELAKFSRKKSTGTTEPLELVVLILMRVIADIHLEKNFEDALALISVIWHVSPIDYSKAMPIDTEVGLSSVRTYIDRCSLILQPDPYSRAFAPGRGSYPKVLRPDGCKRRFFASTPS